MGNEELKLKITSEAEKAKKDVADLEKAFNAAEREAKEASDKIAKLGVATKEQAAEAERAQEKVNALGLALQKTRERAEQAAAEAKRLAEEEKKTAAQAQEAEKKQQALNQVILELANGMGGAVGQTVAFVARLKETAEQGGTTAASLLVVTGVLNGLKSAFGFVAEQIRGAADDGDESAQAIIGSFVHVEDAVEGLVNKVTNELAPGFALLGQATAESIEEAAAWAEENEIGRKTALLLAEALGIVAEVLDVLNTATGYVKDNWDKLKATIVASLPPAVQAAIVLADVADAARDAAGATRDTDDAFEEMYGALFRSIEGNKTLADRLRDVRIGILNLSEAGEAAAASEARYAKGKGDLIAKLQEQLVAEDYTHEQRLKIIREFQTKNEDILSNSRATALAIQRLERQEVLAIEKDKTQLQEDEAKKRTEAAKRAAEEKAKAEKEAAEQSREDMAKAMEQAHETLLEDIEQRQETIEEANQKEIDGLNFKIEEEAQARQKASEQLQETLQADLDAINNAMLGDEEASRRRIAAYQAVANSADATAAQRKAAERSVAAEQAKLLNQQVQQWQGYAQRAGAIVSNMVGQLIFEHKSLSEVLTGLMQQLARSIIETLAKMAVEAIAKAIAQAAATKAAASTEAGAKAATVAPAIASWTASIPWIGPAVYATYYGIFQGLMAAGAAASGATAAGIAGAMEAGTPGSVQDAVPGMGRRDRNTFQLAGSEGVVNEAGMNTTIGQLLAAINRGLPGADGAAGAGVRSGPGASAGSGGAAQKIELEVSFRGGSRGFIRDLMEAINIEVREYGTPLLASRLAIKLPN